MSAYIKAKDAISGKEGILIANIAGYNHIVAECKSINAKMTKNKAEFRSLGHRAKQYKATGWEGSGTMTVHYVTSYWSILMTSYATLGIDAYFTLILTNEDPESDTGKQTVVLTDCNIDDIDIAKLDVDADILDQEINFTYSQALITDMFKPAVQLNEKDVEEYFNKLNEN